MNKTTTASSSFAYTANTLFALTRSKHDNTIPHRSVDALQSFLGEREDGTQLPRAPPARRAEEDEGRRQAPAADESGADDSCAHIQYVVQDHCAAATVMSPFHRSGMGDVRYIVGYLSSTTKQVPALIHRVVLHLRFFLLTDVA